VEAAAKQKDQVSKKNVVGIGESSKMGRRGFARERKRKKRQQLASSPLATYRDVIEICGRELSVIAHIHALWCCLYRRSCRVRRKTKRRTNGKSARGASDEARESERKAQPGRLSIMATAAAASKQAI